MIARIKAFANAAQGFIIYIFTPIAFVVGYIWFLFQKQHALEDKISDLTRDDRQKEFEGKVKADENDVQQTGSDYDSLRAQYLAKSGKGGGDVPPNNSGS